MKNFRNRLFLILTAIFVIWCSACEVGLGSEVDTDAPLVTITYPPESSVIKGSFILSGTCTDDIQVASVSVTIKNSNTNEVLGTYSANINGETWSVELNKEGPYNGFEYADGRYSVDVSAKDTSERVSGISSLSFDIDNTAPVLILSKPLATGSEAATVYGQSIKIAGDISEEHITNSLVMKIQQWDTTTNTFIGDVKEISVSDFSTMSSDNPLIIAKYYSNQQIALADESSRQGMEDLRNKYLQIYGAITENPDGSFTSDGDKTFYATILLKDNAREYKKPGDSGVETGNTCENYYINSTDFYNNLMSENAYSLNATKIRKILNKTSKEYNDENKAKIIQMLPEYSLSSNNLTINSSKFSVNPDNNPVYIINEYEQGFAGENPVNSNISSEEERSSGYRTLYRGSIINLTLEAGKDAFLIKPETVSVKVYKMDSSTDTDFAHKSSDKIYEILSAGDWTGSSSTNLGTTLLIENTTVGGANAPFTDSFYESGEYYRVIVDGQDIEGGSLTSKCNTGYGFLINSNSNPPTVNISTASDEYKSGKNLSDGIEIKFSVTTSGETENPKVTFTKNDAPIKNHVSILKETGGAAGVKVVNTSTGSEVNNLAFEISEISFDAANPNVLTQGGNYTYNVVFKLKHVSGDIPEGKYKCSFALKVADSVLKSTTVPFTFYLDNEKPQIKNEKITPVEDGNIVNGKITITANATDNQEVKEISYKVFVGSDTEPKATGSTSASTFGTLTSPSAIFDTSAYGLPIKDKDNNEVKNPVPIKIEIIATDHVGNISETKTLNYTIDQTSDRPVITEQNFKSEMAKTDVNSTNGNVFDKGAKLIGSIYDTDEIEEASYEVYDESSTNKVSGKTLSNVNGSIFNIEAPKTCGYYKVVLSVKDKTWDSGDTNTKPLRMVEKSFWIAVDSAAPTFTLKTIDDSNENISSTQYKSGNVKYVGIVKDDWELEGVYAYFDSTEPNVTVTVDKDNPNADGTYNWNCELPLSEKNEDSYSVKFIAKDKAGKTREIVSNIVKDNTPPNFADKDYKAITANKITINKPEKGYFKDGTVEISGYAFDSISEIKSVEYSLDGTDYNPLNIEYNKVANVDGTTTENKKQVKFSGTAFNVNNGKTIKVKVKDISGQESIAESDLILIDAVAPTITLTSSNTISVNGKSAVTIKGTVSDGDSGSGVEVMYFKVNSKINSGETPHPVTPDENGNWTCELLTSELAAFGNSSTSGSIYVLAVDKAGNETSIPLVSVVYDINFPVAKIEKVKYKKADNNGNIITKANGYITFEGTASDNHELKKVYLEYSTDKSTWNKIGLEQTENVNNWSIDVNTTELTTTTGEYYFRAVGVDSLGNTGNTGKLIANVNNAYETAEAKFEKITVDQESDRPVIKLTNVEFNYDEEGNLKSTQWLTGTNNLFISVTDDDGVNSVKYNERGNIDFDASAKTITNKIELEDGAHTLYFQVKDEANPDAGIFDTDKTKRPIIVDKNNREFTGNVLKLNIDKTAPAINTIKYSISNKEESNSNLLKFGGKNNVLKVTFKASDANFISNVKIQETITVEDKANNITRKEWFGTCSDSNYNDTAEHLWTIELKDKPGESFLKELASNTYGFKIIVTDGAGLTNERSFNLTIDNTPATLVVDSHIRDELVGQDFILKGIVKDADTSTKIKYQINSTPDELDETATGWKEYANSATVASWRIYIDGGTASDTETHEITLKDLFVSVYSDKVTKNAENKVVYKSGANANKLYTNLDPIYFHFLTEDGVGNINKTTFSLKVDPQGDLPTVKMTYPVATNEIENSVTLSGYIRAQGEAEAVGDNTVVGVYMQIDPAYRSSFTDKWTKTSTNDPYNIAGPKGPEYKLYNFYKDNDTSLFEKIYDRYNRTAASDKKKPETENTEYGIYVGNKNNWSITLNKNGELNGTEATNDKDEKYIQINRVAIRLIVVDSAGNKTVTNPLLVDVDSDAPIFGTEQFYVWQYGWVNRTDGKTYYSNTANPASGAQLYSDSGCRTSASGKTYSSSSYTRAFLSLPYEDDMSLKGEWWLSGSVEDESDIYMIKEEKSDVQVVKKDNGDKDGTFTSGTSESNVTRYTPASGNTGFIFNYRVGSTEEGAYGKRTYQFKATEYNAEENLRKPSEKIFSVNFDNKAPVVETDGVYFKMESIVANSNGFYTVGTRAKEEGDQSGFARAVFYFTKNSNAKVYDTYIKKGETGNELTSASNLEKINGLYWQKTTANSISGSTVTITAVNDNKNIHRGDLVLFAGAYYTVTGISGNNITLNNSPSESLAGGPIYFAIGHVVDNEKTESKGSSLKSDIDGYGYYADGDTDDDYMYETVANGVGNTIWTGTVNSNNIADGAATLHYVVFDKSGNYAENTLDVIIGNNAPRLASVQVMCDYDGSGNFGDNGNTKEVKAYYYSERKRVINIDGENKTVSRAGDVTKRLTVTGENGVAFMSVKDKLKFVPEIVGGNGNLYYSSQIDNGTVSYVSDKLGNGNDDGNLFEPSSKSENKYLTYDENGNSYAHGNSNYAMEIPYASISSSSLTGENEFKFTIYDSADGCTTWNAGATGVTGRLSATMNIKLNVLQDTQVPNTNVKRFFYQNKNKNSLYKNSAENGHIELEDYLTTEVTAALGYDPKVSGKITIRGTAFDDIRLSQLNVQFLDHEKIGSSTLAAEYTSGAWESKSEDTNMSTNGWTFTVTDRYNDERGHFVDWECNIDTSFITNVAELDRVFTITAKDARGNNGSGQTSATGSGVASANDTTYDGTKEADTLNRPTYQMDVVPYIRRLHTSLSTANSSNPSVYDRTSSGHYPVYVTYSSEDSGTTFQGGEKIQLVGFNLVKGNGNVDYDLHTDNSGTKTDTVTSGPFSYSVNGISILNNINNNDAKGYDLNADGSIKPVTLSQSNYSTYAYNRQANDTNNNLLTDDVYIDVWQINNKAAMPSDNFALNMNMQINPSNGVIGFAFNSGVYNWYAPDKTVSYMQITSCSDFTRCSSFAYDKEGNSYGTVLPGNEGDVFRLYSTRWNNFLSIGSLASGTQDKDRYQSMSYASNVVSSNTYLYMAYLDQLTGKLALKYGIISGDGSSGASANGTFTDGDATTANCILIGDSTGSSNALGKSGEFVSVGVTSDNVVVVVWYDSSKLMYAYRQFGLKSDNTTIEPKGSSWTIVKDLLPNGGKYCKVVVDNADGIHIAAYDVLNADLKYFYFSNYNPNATGVTKKTAVVDSYLTIGQNITLDVAADGSGNQIPYIGYWGTYPKRPRYAYLKTPSASDWDGVKNNKYTGVWECTLVPSASEVYIDENTPWRVNVGVWKYNGTPADNGKLAYSTTGTNRGKSTGTNSYTSSTASSTTGTCYGNGTSNAVLSYLRTNPANAATNFVETAQLK